MEFTPDSSEISTIFIIFRSRTVEWTNLWGNATFFSQSSVQGPSEHSELLNRQNQSAKGNYETFRVWNSVLSSLCPIISSSSIAPNSAIRTSPLAR